MAKKIDSIKSEELGVVVPIYLDTKHGEFSATFNGATAKENDLPTIKKKVEEWFKTSAQPMVWHKIIEIKSCPPDDYRQEESAGFGFTFERMQIAQRPNGTLAKHEWDFDVSKRPSSPHSLDWDEDEPLKLPYLQGEPRERWDDATRRKLIPYDEKVWDQLTALANAGKKVQALVEKMFRTSDGLNKFKTIDPAQLLTTLSKGGAK
jgi:hypothetical protein